MSKSKEKNQIYSDSYSDSGSEKELNAGDESADSDNSDFNESHKFVNSTKVDNVKSESNVKLSLAELISNDKSSKLRYSKAIKKVPWDEIKIKGFTKEELQKHLNEIIKAVGTVRTLEEVLEDYKINHVKFDRDNHPDKPVKPQSAHVNYLKENREKLQKKYEKANPGVKVNFMELMKFACEKFNNLPEDKKEPYLTKYKAAFQEFQAKKKAFITNHPELKNKRAKRTRKESKSASSVLTPFGQFRNKLAKDDEQVSYLVAQKLWKDLPDNERLKFIEEVANLDTEEEKKISKGEWKLLESQKGPPKRPLPPYNLFVSKFREDYKGDMKNLMTKAGSAWKKMGEDDKREFHLQHEESLAEWRIKLKSYIKKLPKDQQPMMLAKFKTELSGDSKDKSRKSEKSFIAEDSGSEEESKDKTKTPKKKKNKKFGLEYLDTADESTPVSKKRKNSEVKAESDEEVSPSKKSKNGESSSKKKTKLKSESDEEEISPPKKMKNGETSQDKKTKKPPVYPSMTTAHYFMTQFNGEKSELKKAYKNLNRLVKGKFSGEMRKARQKFLEDSVAYLEKLKSPAEVEAYKRKMKENKEKQMKEIAWHSSTGTDTEGKQTKKEASSSESSDDDSDSS